MPRCIITQDNVPGDKAIPAYVDGELIGYVSLDVYSGDWNAPDRKHVTFGE